MEQNIIYIINIIAILFNHFPHSILGHYYLITKQIKHLHIFLLPSFPTLPPHFLNYLHFLPFALTPVFSYSWFVPPSSGKFYHFPPSSNLFDFIFTHTPQVLTSWSELRACQILDRPQLIIFYILYLYFMSLSNNSSSSDRIKNKDESSTKGNSKSCSSSQKKIPFLNSTIFNRETILNEKNNKSALQSILGRLKLQAIRNGPTFIQIIAHQQQEELKKKSMRQNLILSPESQQAKEYQQINRKLTNKFEQFKVKMLHNSYEYSSNSYQSWLREMQNRNFISWFMPIRQNSTQIKSISISHKILALMGYTPQEAALSLSEYKSNCLNFLNNEAYYQFFWTYTNFFSKFVECELEGNIGRAEIIQESENVIVNELIGKNQRRIKTQMRIWMPSPFIMCMQLLTIAKGQKMYDPSLEICRKKIEQIYNTELTSSLSHILNFPKPRIAEKKLAMCSYVVIDNFLQ